MSGSAPATIGWSRTRSTGHFWNRRRRGKESCGSRAATPSCSGGAERNWSFWRKTIFPLKWCPASPAPSRCRPTTGFPLHTGISPLLSISSQDTDVHRKARMSPQTNTLPPEPGPGRLQKRAEAPGPGPERLQRRAEASGPGPERLQKRAEAPGLQPEQLQKRAEAPGLQPGRLKRRSEAPVRDRVMRTVWGSTMKPWSAHTAH